jgi:acetylornithine deacetylase/succinyl-diaminopimelate desuccinylase-like protein
LPVETTRGTAFLISLGEKGRLEAHFKINGRSSHAARPWLANNALYKLGQLLERLRAYQPEIDVSGDIFGALPLFGIDDTPTPGNLDRLLEQLGVKDAAKANVLKASSRMTLVPTMTSAGLKSNSIPATAGLTCDIRSLPHQDVNYVRGELEKLTEGIEGITLRLDVTAKANASRFDDPFVSLLGRATALALGRDEVTLVPSLSAGFTDSRCVRPLGAEVYGFAPLDPELDTSETGVHGVDEAFAIENLVLRTKMLVALAYLALGDG